VLAITTTVRNRGVTVAMFFIQRATREVACVCYKMLFRRVLDINPEWAPWHVRVAREVLRKHPSATEEPPAAVEQAPLDGVRKVASGVLIGITLDFSASLAGGACDALVGVGSDGFPVDEHAAHLLFGCASYANRLCHRAQVAFWSLMRRLMTCHNRETAEKPRKEVVSMEPGEDCTGVIGISRLRPGFCPAYSMANHLQRSAASSTTNLEESLHDRMYKLAGRRQPLMAAMTGAKYVDMTDIDDICSGRGAGPRTSVEHCMLSEQRRKSCLRKRTGDGTTCAVEGGAGASDDGLRAEAPKKLACPAARRTMNKAVAASSAPD